MFEILGKRGEDLSSLIDSRSITIYTDAISLRYPLVRTAEKMYAKESSASYDVKKEYNM